MCRINIEKHVELFRKRSYHFRAKTPTQNITSPYLERLDGVRQSSCPTTELHVQCHIPWGRAHCLHSRTQPEQPHCLHSSPGRSLLIKNDSEVDIWLQPYK